MNAFLSKVIDMMTIDNSSLKTIIALLPENQQQNAVEILMGTAPVVNIGTDYYSKTANDTVLNKVFTLISYNPLTRKCEMEYMEIQRVYASHPFAKDSDELKQFAEEIAKLSVDEAKNFVNAFSGSERGHFNTKETRRQVSDYDLERVLQLMTILD